MSSRLDVRSAPVKEGTYSGGNFSGTGLTTSYSGKYVGDLTRSLLIQRSFPAAGTATFGTDRIVFDCTELSAIADGALFPVEFPASYTGGPVPVIDGLSLGFNVGGIINAAALSFVAMAPQNLVPADYFELTDDGINLVMYLLQNDLEQADSAFETSDGRVILIKKAVRRAVALQADYMGLPDTVTRAVMEAKRQLVTIGENYDVSTRLLFRGGLSMMPMIGTVNTTTRTSDGYPYRDPLSGKYKVAPPEAPGGDSCPMGPGYNEDPVILDSQREVSPLRGAHVGRAFETTQAITNILPHWKTMQENNGTATLYWTAGGGASSGAFGPYRGILDSSESTWPSRWLIKNMRSILPTVATDYIQSEEGTCAPGDHLCGGVWVLGTGAVKIQVLTGAPAAATTLLHENTALLDANQWRFISTSDFSAVVPGGHTAARLRLECFAAQTVIETDICGLYRTSMMPPLLPSDGTAAAIQQSEVQFGTPAPQDGFLFFAIQIPMHGVGGVFDLIRSGGSHFLFQRDMTSGAEEWLWRTASGGTPLVVTDNPTAWGAHKWLTVCLAWRPSITAGELERSIYINGLQVGNDSTTSFAVTWSSLLLGGTPATGLPTYGLRWQEVRMDAGFPDATAVLAMHNRLAEGDDVQTNIDLQGRYYRIMQEASPWRHPLYPHQVVAQLGFQEHDAHDPSTVFGR